MNIITISCLGRFGRFGNQLFQYAFARAYAEATNSILQTPRWIGSEIFDLDDPLISTHLPATALDEVPWGQTNIDLYGYFQFHEATSILSISKLKKWFKIKNDLMDAVPIKNDYIAIHLRRGDYVDLAKHGVFKVIDQKCYLDACKQFNLDESKIIWISDATPSNNTFPPHMAFLEDFIILMRAPILLRANSSFSWWAGTLGDGITYSPVIDEPIYFIKGNYPKFAHVPKHDDFIIKD